MAETKTTTNNEKQKPVHEVRIGCVKATVWANAVKRNHGEGPAIVMYNAVPSRSYMAQDGNWATSHSFGRDELPVVSKAIDMALSWICETEQQAREQSA